MAHKTLIGGTAYEIDGGKTLINGTAYSIDKGKTLVGGTVYEIGFVQLATLTITPYSDWGEYVIDGTTYSGTSTITLEVPIGTVVTCKMSTEDSYTSSSRPYVTVNGTKVFTGSSGVDYPTYNYTVVGNATLVSNRGSSSGNRYGYITITET